MGSKKAVKPTTRSSTRERSKSVGRATPKSRARTPTRSRSRSRVTSSTNKRSRTPASESKVRRRRDSSSSSSDRSKVSRALSKERKLAPDAAGDKTTRLPSAYKETLPSRFSQRIIHKIENTRASTAVPFRSTSPVVHRTSNKYTSLCGKTCAFLGKICPPPILATLGLLTLLPCTFWLNLLVLSPATSIRHGAQDTKASQTPWGPAYRFAGVNWPIDFYVYFDVRCVGFVAAYLLLHVLMRLIPIGYRVSSQVESRRLDHRCNGFLMLLVMGGLFSMAQFCTWGILPSMRPSFLLPKYHYALMVAAGKIGTLLAVISFIASKRIPRSQVNPEGNTGNVIVDFWAGRSIRPRWFGIDWKMLVLQPGCTAMLLIELTYLCVQWERFGRVSPALVALTAMHSVWMADLFLFEHTMISSFEVRREGFGYYQIVGSIVMAFLYSTPAIYLSWRPNMGRLYTLDGHLDVANCVLLGLSIIFFMVGLYIYRVSNSQKDLFRRQPNHPSFVDVDKISGPHSQRLLAGGWWGVVRHPNYLGELIAAYAISLPAGFISPIPWIYPVFLTCFMVHRILRIEALSADKYGLSLDMYKKLVPYALVPRIC